MAEDDSGIFRSVSEQLDPDDALDALAKSAPRKLIWASKSGERLIGCNAKSKSPRRIFANRINLSQFEVYRPKKLE